MMVENPLQICIKLANLGYGMFKRLVIERKLGKPKALPVGYKASNNTNPQINVVDLIATGCSLLWNR